jgi:hypothetical protein
LYPSKQAEMGGNGCKDRHGEQHDGLASCKVQTKRCSHRLLSSILAFLIAGKTDAGEYAERYRREAGPLNDVKMESLSGSAVACAAATTPA